MQDAGAPGDTAFSRLPTEVLDMIADAYCNDPYYYHDNYKTTTSPSLPQLRLISHDFSRLPSINRRLFLRISLVASPEEVARLQLAPYELLARYTEEVVFKPSTYSWLVNPKLFREIVQTQALHQSIGDHYRSGMGSTKQGIYSDSVLQRHEHNFVHPFEEESPFTEAELDQGYLEYRTNALAARSLMRGTALRDQWAQALQRLPRAYKFTAGMREFDNTGSWAEIDPFDFPPTPCAIQQMHPHDDVHTHWRCMQVLAPVGDAILMNVQSALQAIPAQVKSFTVQSAMSPTLLHPSFPDKEDVYTSDVEDLRFEGMVKLKYRPTIMGEWIVPPNYQEETDRTELVVDLEQANNLSRLLRVCNETLVDLRIGKDGLAPMRWPPQQAPPPLPALQTLLFRDIKIDVNRVGPWLRGLQCLKQFVVYGGKRTLDSDCWKPFFKAIREHANKPTVELQWLRVGNDNFSQENSHVHIHLPEAEDTMRLQATEANSSVGRPLSRMHRSLALYLLNQGQWDNVLEQHFPQI